MLYCRVGQFDFRPASFSVHNSAVSGRTTLKFDMGPYDSPVELVSKFGVNQTSLTMRVGLGLIFQDQRKRVELSNPTILASQHLPADVTNFPRFEGSSLFPLIVPGSRDILGATLYHSVGRADGRIEARKSDVDGHRC